MPDTEIVRELLLQWDENTAATPEELCKPYADRPDHGELLEALRNAISDLRAASPFVAPSTDAGSVSVQTTPYGAGSPGVPEPSLSSDALASPAGLRYRPVAHHRQGGLGEVLLADDTELHRKVALKRIRTDRCHDASSKRDFLREAEITAKLEHPGVVPVLGLVHDADGQPYYAMRFIEGESLNDAVQRFHEADKNPKRDPGERSLALRELLNRFVAVCNTIAYAHSRGVLHRDLKPQNIMLGKYGETLVVDWGLAKSFERSDEARADGEETVRPSSSQPEGQETRAGDIKGAPGYMSPEQASGRIDEIGTASDVFALGATLYAILTGVAPYKGQGAVLKAGRAEFAAPRNVKSQVPAALEAICLKAMALKPEDRYTTAKGLAEDVEKWLADEPVEAWREPFRIRARRWGRRHRALVSGLAALFLTVLVLGGAAGAWYQRYLAERHAEAVQREAEQRKGAEAALAEAQRLMDRMRWPQARAVLAQASAQLGEEAPDDCRQQLQQALSNVQIATQLDAIRLQKIKPDRSGKLDRNRIDRDYAAAFQKAGLIRDEDGPTTVAERIRQSDIRSGLVASLDDWAGTTNDPKQVLWLLRVAREADPERVRDQVRDPVAWGDREVLSRRVGEVDVAALSPQLLATLGGRLRELGAESVPLLAKARERYPDDFWVNLQLAVSLKKPEEFEESLGYLRAAQSLRPDAIEIYLFIGAHLMENGRVDDAIASLQAAIDLEPLNALAHANLGHAQDEKGFHDQAILTCRKAVTLDPRNAQAHHNLGKCLISKGLLDDAVAALNLSVKLAPNEAKYYSSLGGALCEKGMLDEALDACRIAVKLEPNDARWQHNLGVTQARKGLLTDAVDSLRKAAELDPKDAASRTSIGGVLLELGKQEEALASHRKAVELGPKKASTHYGLGITLYTLGRMDEAITAYKNAIAVDPNFYSTYGNLGQILMLRGSFAEAGQAFQRFLDLAPREHPARITVLQHMEECKRLATLDSTLDAILSGTAQPRNVIERIDLAQICQNHRHLFAAAVRFYTEAFADKPELADTLKGPHRYNAACTAALAGYGQGNDADKLDVKERARFRKQALTWLRADLTAWSDLLAKEPEKARGAVEKTIAHWQQDTDFAGVRGEALAKLSEEERKSWQKLWEDVELLRNRASPSK
jgi:serine/threonine-protein kinase